MAAPTASKGVYSRQYSASSTAIEALATAPSINNDQLIAGGQMTGPTPSLYGPKSVELPMNSWFNMRCYFDVLSHMSSYTNSVNPYSNFPYTSTTAWPGGGTSGGSVIGFGGSGLRIVFDTGKPNEQAKFTGGTSPSNDITKNLLYLDIPWPNTKDTTYTFADISAANDFSFFPKYMTIWVQNFRWVRGTQNGSRPGLADPLFKYGDTSASGSSMQAEFLLDNVRLINFWPDTTNLSAPSTSINGWAIRDQTVLSPFNTLTSTTYTGSAMSNGTSLFQGGPQMNMNEASPAQYLTIGVDDKAQLPSQDDYRVSGYLLFNDFETVNYPLLNRVNTARLLGASGATLSSDLSLSGTALSMQGQKLGSQFMGGGGASASASMLGTVANTAGNYEDPTHRGPRVYAVSGAENIANTLSLATGSNTTMSQDGFTQKGFARWNVSGSATNAQATYSTWGRRENVLAATKVTAIADTDPELSKFQVRVANPERLTPLNPNERYILFRAYRQNSNTAGDRAYCRTDLALSNTSPVTDDDSIVTFTADPTLADDGSTTLIEYGTLPELYISPWKYWMNILFPGTDDTTPLIPRTFGQVCMVNETPSDSSSTQLGTTWKESTYTYYTAFEATGGASAPYAKPWEFSTNPTTSVLDLETDYGHGIIDDNDPNGLGCVDKQYAVSGNYIDLNLTPLITTNKIKPEQDFNIFGKLDAIIQDKTVKIVADSGTIVSNTGSYKPAFYMRYYDTPPEIPTLTVSSTVELVPKKASKEIDLYAIKSQDLNSVTFNWNEKDDDIWYRYILRGENLAISDKYSAARTWIPLNEAPSNQDISIPPTFYVHDPKNSTAKVALTNGGSTATAGVHSDFDGMSGFTAHFDGSDDNYLTYTSANNSFPSGSANTGFSIVVHAVPAPEATGGTSLQYMYYRDDGVRVGITGATTTAPKVFVSGAGAQLTGSTILPLDGITPVNIIAVFRKNSEIGPDAKLYVNGVLEDFVDAATGSVDGTDPASIGMFRNVSAGTSNNKYYGTIEEIVMYDQDIIVPDEANKMIYNTAQLEDKNTDGLITHTAKLFLFDYTNIRGKSAKEVSSSNVVSWRATTL